MDPITYEALMKNPELLEALQLQAHRERSYAMHRLLVAPVVARLSRLFKGPGFERKAAACPS